MAVTIIMIKERKIVDSPFVVSPWPNRRLSTTSRQWWWRHTKHRGGGGTGHSSSSRRPPPPSPSQYFVSFVLLFLGGGGEGCQLRFFFLHVSPANWQYFACHHSPTPKTARLAPSFSNPGAATDFAFEYQTITPFWCTHFQKSPSPIEHSWLRNWLTTGYHYIEVFAIVGKAYNLIRMPL